MTTERLAKVTTFDALPEHMRTAYGNNFYADEPLALWGPNRSRLVLTGWRKVGDRPGGGAAYVWRFANGAFYAAVTGTDGKLSTIYAEDSPAPAPTRARAELLAECLILPCKGDGCDQPLYAERGPMGPEVGYAAATGLCRTCNEARVYGAGIEFVIPEGALTHFAGDSVCRGRCCDLSCHRSLFRPCCGACMYLSGATPLPTPEAVA